MTDERDPVLQALFAEANVELDADAFTARLMARTNILRYRVIAAGIVVALLLLAVALVFSLPLQQFSVLLTQALGTELISLGETTVAWLLAPINNIATVLVVFAKALRMIWNKARSMSYAY